VDESLTITVKKLVPTVDGVPLIAPEVESNSPAGREPEARLQEYGGVPPLALSATLYGTFTTPLGKLVVTMPTGESMATVYDRDAVTPK
jgi:hypothetical protein